MDTTRRLVDDARQGREQAEPDVAVRGRLRRRDRDRERGDGQERDEQTEQQGHAGVAAGRGFTL